MVKSLIAGNWKMNKSLDEAIELIETLANIDIKEGREVLICPPSVYLDRANELLEESNIQIGGQNFYYENSGAYTGEVSAEMLKSVGASHVLIGHSERREIFGEDDDLINKKVAKAVEENITAVLCIGETQEEREENIHFDKIKSQVEKALKNITKDQMAKVVIAYEPIWAIGTGLTASAEDAEEMCKFIRENIEEMYDSDVSENIQILYGGSVNPQTISDLMSKDNVNGALVGGASLIGKDFESIINYE